MGGERGAKVGRVGLRLGRLGGVGRRRFWRHWCAVALAATLLAAAAACSDDSGPGASTTASAGTSSTNVADLRAAILADLPVIDGSTSTEPMRMLLVCGLVATPCDWTGDPAYSPERWVRPRDPDSDPAQRVVEHVVTSGTHDSYLSLVAGASDVIVVARAPSDEEQAAAEAAGIGLEVKAVALDAFVFLVNGGSPVGDLTIDQIRGIYSGRITDWSQLGGPALAIQPYQRDPTSGSQELMLRLVMGDLAMVEAPDWLMLYAMIGPFNALATDPGGIGYSVYYYAEFMQPESNAVRMIAVEGVFPTAVTISTGEYPLVAEVYAVVRSGEFGSARAFFDWLTTDDGQQAVAATGYVPLP